MRRKIARSLRVIKSLEVVIKNFNDENLYALTLNISIGGFAIQCSTMERNQLTPQGDFVDDGRPIEVEVNLQLKNQQGQNEPIYARCRVVYSRRLAQDKCQIGMSFIELYGDGKSKLLMFIKNSLKVQ